MVHIIYWTYAEVCISDPTHPTAENPDGYHGVTWGIAICLVIVS